MKVEWLQVPAEAVEHRSLHLARLLSHGSGRRVSEGDALLLIVRVWQWALNKVDANAPDLSVEFRRCSTLPEARAAETLATACRWPMSKADVLLEALCDAEVQAVAREGAAVRVLGLAERYTTLAEKQRDNKGRATASKLAKKHGWKHDPVNGGYVGPTGAHATNWQELIVMLKA